MKTIYLMRHAKSSWKDGSLEDLSRPLNKRGRQTAVAMGRFLAEAGIVPATILCSPSVRTRDTLDAIAEAFAEPVPTRFEQGIYDAEAGALLERLCRLNDQLASVMIVGHNPGLEDLARLLAPESARTHLTDKFPTGSLAIIEADPDAWAEITPGCGRIVRLVRGRSLLDTPGS